MISGISSDAARWIAIAKHSTGVFGVEELTAIPGLPRKKVYALQEEQEGAPQQTRLLLRSLIDLQCEQHKLDLFSTSRLGLVDKAGVMSLSIFLSRTVW